MVNNIINNELKKLKELLYNSRNPKDYEIILRLIDKDISKEYLDELSHHFGFGKTFCSSHFSFINKLTNEYIDIRPYVATVEKELSLEISKMEDSQEFTFNKDTAEFTVNFYQIKFIATNTSEDIKNYAINLAKKYQKIGKFAKCETRFKVTNHLLQNKYFINNFGQHEKFRLMKKLNLPEVKILSENEGILIYSNHVLDNKQVIAIKFNSLFENLQMLPVEAFKC